MPQVAAIESVTDGLEMSVSKKRAAKSTLRKADDIEIEATLTLVTPALVIVKGAGTKEGEKRAKNSTKRSIIGSTAPVSTAAGGGLTVGTVKKAPILRADITAAVTEVIINMIGVRAFLVMLINS